MLRASQRKASFYRPTIPTNQPEPIQHSSSSPTLPPPAANHFVQETSLIGSAMRKVLSIFWTGKGERLKFLTAAQQTPSRFA